MIWRLSYLASVASLAGWLALAGELAHPVVPMPRPQEGMVANGTYTNKYFHLSYPVPSGWTEQGAGPAPSRAGYYVLDTWVPTVEPRGTVLIAAQDTFFVPKALRDTMPAAHELGRTMAALPGMTIDRQPEEATISGRPFGRVDFSGVGLLRSTWITQIRCHLVSFNLMANTREQLDLLVRSLDKIVYSGDKAAEGSDPVCIDNYASAENLVAKVNPEITGPTFTPIPIRIVISVDGSVKNVHVIRATAGQRNSIEKALGQWKFRPRGVDGRMEEIETGVLLEFRPGGVVRYLGG